MTEETQDDDKSSQPRVSAQGSKSRASSERIASSMKYNLETLVVFALCLNCFLLKLNNKKYLKWTASIKL